MGALSRRHAIGAAAATALLGHAARAADPPAFRGAAGQFTLIEPARKAPLMAVEDESGKRIDLEQALRGKVAALNFWATWCAPCLIELPTLDRLEGELGGERFAVVAISVDAKGMDVVGPYWKGKGFRHLAIRLDPRGNMMRAFGVRGLPTTYLIDHAGMSAGYLEGHGDWASPPALALARYYLDRGAGAR